MNRTRATIDILSIAWVLSVIPVMLALVHSAAGFPDTAPHYGLGAWLCFGLFAILQIAVTVVGLGSQHLTVRSVLVVCISVLALFLEFMALFILMLIYPLVIIAAGITALVLAIRFIRHQ